MGCPDDLQYHNYPVKPPKPDDKDPDEAENGNSDSEHCGIPSDNSSDYSPVSPATSDESIDSNYEDTDVPTSGEKKIIVFESQLDKLFRVCQQCGSIITSKTKHYQGSMIIIKITCLNRHSKTWKSQPMVNGAAAGNLMIPASILFSGNTYQHIHHFALYLNLQFISSSHYYSTQDKFLFPVINKAWESNRDGVIQQLKQVPHIDICGDGRCDSPGHSAKYGTYSMMDEKSGKLVDFSVVQVTEVTSSNAMEYEGCKRTLNALLQDNIPVRCLTTDQHTTITARMKSDYPNIKHQYDVWHLSKWVTKKLIKKAKKKKCAQLMPWIQSVSNHFRWSASTCDGNADMLQEKWVSILHHIVDKHSWNDHHLFNKCCHPRMSKRE